MTPEQKIIAIAEWEGWVKTEHPDKFKLGQNLEKGIVWSTWTHPVHKPVDDEGGYEPWHSQIVLPPYLTSRDAICGAVARLDDVRLREYAKNLQEVCHQYCVGVVPDYQHDLSSLAKLTLATPTQLADALLLTLGHEI